MKKNNIIFLGTSAFAATILNALLTCKDYSIGAIITQPDRPAGRGKKIIKSPVKEIAEANNIPVFQPEKLKNCIPDLCQQLSPLGPFQLGIVVAYGQIIPESFLNFPALRMINVHGSILPKWRGAAPIQRSLMAGEKQTGITLMQMEAGLDSGPIIRIATCDIQPEDNFLSLHNRLAETGAKLLTETLPEIITKNITAIRQNDSEATYASKITTAEEVIDWNQSAFEINNLVRGLSPRPGAYTLFGGKRLKILAAEVRSEPFKKLTPGQISMAEKNILEVNCQNGALLLKEVQLEGKTRMPVEEFLKGLNLAEGLQLG